MAKKIAITEDLKGDPLFKFLIENKSALIAQKKSMAIKYSMPISSNVDRLVIDKEGKLKALGDGVPVITNSNELWVKTVANACYWVDSDMDVLIKDSSKKTISQRKGLLVHLHDHVHEVEAQVGDVQDVYLEDVALRKLGLNKSGTTQCIIFETLLQRDYNPRVFDLYKAAKIKQHSIGLQYVRIELAINAPEYEKEMDFWNKYYGDILNKDVVDEAGFFWVVQEIKLLENSCVLFGANELTPTLEIGKNDHSTGTAKRASQLEPDDFDLDAAIKKIKFF
jgi:hypothetical protein